MDLKEQKQRLKNAIKERLERMSDNDRKVESRSMCKQLLMNLPHEPLNICAYYPLRDEADVRPALLNMLEMNMRVFLPCFEDGKLAFRQITTIKNLREGPFHIPEPEKDAALLKVEELDYALIPGRGFNKRGDRIGRGNGGYDKWLKTLRAANTKVKVWGIALDCQIHDDIPMEAHDQPMDGIVLARGFVDCALERAKKKA